MPTGNLPEGAKKIFTAAEAAAKKGTCKDAGERKDECAARVAWSAVKKKYKKVGDKWVPKAELSEFSMVITKASLDKTTQTMRWAAVASDTKEDSYKDNMTLELFSDFLDRIEKDEKVPDVFRSDFWQGGMPYLSVSHYPDYNGEGVPGTVDSVYVDGDRLKATGRFDKTPLGYACFDAVCKDLYSEERSEADDKVRISIAFLDYRHRHKSNNTVFERKEGDILCGECLKEMITGKSEGLEYSKGQLVHLALTRVPVNKRTDIIARSEIMVTQEEDAASIVGELAEELEEKKLTGKSEALVIKSDGEDEETEPVELEERGQYPHKKDKKADEDEDEEDKKKKKMKSEAAEVEPIEEEDMSDIHKELAELKAMLTKEEPVVEAHPLDPAIGKLKAAFDEAVTLEDKSQAVPLLQERLNEVSKAINDAVTEQTAEAPASETVALAQEIAKSLADQLRPVQEQIGLLNARLDGMDTGKLQQQVPTRRSVAAPPQLWNQPPEIKSETPKLRALINKTVGLQ